MTPQQQLRIDAIRIEAQGVFESLVLILDRSSTLEPWETLSEIRLRLQRLDLLLLNMQMAEGRTKPPPSLKATPTQTLDAIEELLR